MDRVMASPIHSTVVGVFDNVEHARAAADEFRQLGFPKDCVCVRTPRSRKLVDDCTPHEVDQDFPSEDPEWIRHEIKAGKTVLFVRHADQQAEEVRELVRKHGGSISEPTDLGTYGHGLPATPF
jgi:hypothetical protein